MLQANRNSRVFVVTERDITENGYTIVAIYSTQAEAEEKLHNMVEMYPVEQGTEFNIQYFTVR